MILGCSQVWTWVVVCLSVQGVPYFSSYGIWDGAPSLFLQCLTTLSVHYNSMTPIFPTWREKYNNRILGNLFLTSIYKIRIIIKNAYNLLASAIKILFWLVFFDDFQVFAFCFYWHFLWKEGCTLKCVFRIPVQFPLSKQFVQTELHQLARQILLMEHVAGGTIACLCDITIYLLFRILFELGWKG